MCYREVIVYFFLNTRSLHGAKGPIVMFIDGGYFRSILTRSSVDRFSRRRELTETQQNKRNIKPMAY